MAHSAGYEACSSREPTFYSGTRETGAMINESYVMHSPFALENVRNNEPLRKHAADR